MERGMFIEKTYLKLERRKIRWETALATRILLLSRFTLTSQPPLPELGIPCVCGRGSLLDTSGSLEGDTIRLWKGVFDSKNGYALGSYLNVVSSRKWTTFMIISLEYLYMPSCQRLMENPGIYISLAHRETKQHQHKQKTLKKSPFSCW